MRYGTKPAIRLACLCAAAVLSGGTALGQPEPKKDGSAPRRPNVVLIITDDMD